MRLALLVVALGAWASADAEPFFEDVALSAGVSFKHTNRTFHNPYAHIMEGYTALGAAVAVADFDHDGFEDLFVTDSQDGAKNRLFKNRGDFTFVDVAEKAGVALGNDPENASADALFFDGNGDGWDDLLVVRFGQNLYFENQKDGTFKDKTIQSGLTKYLNAITAIAFDLDNDRDLDLLLGNYFQPENLFKPSTSRFFPESFETAANGGGLTFFKNNGDGTFVDATAAAGFANHQGWTLDLGHADGDLDGDEDVYVAADFGTDRYYRNNGDGTFTDTTKQAIGIDTKKGMNVDWGDYNGDGLFDIYVTNITDEYMNEGNFLWQNNGDGTFVDVAPETGTRATGWGWAGKFFDYDNDGWQDLYVVNGWVSAGPENYVLDVFELIIKKDIDLADAKNWPPMGNKTLSGYQKNRLFHNQAGASFKDEAGRHKVDSLKDGRGVGVADFDHDGRLDLFVTNANGLPHFFRNSLPTAHHWIGFDLIGTASNPSAIGARVTLIAGGHRQILFVNGGNGFASQSSRRLHFGLGKAEKVEKVEVRWPSGRTQIFENVAIGKLWRLREADGLEAPGTR